MAQSQFDRNQPFNHLPALPPAADVETAAILKKAITASRALADLKGMAERMHNQAMLIDSLVLQEPRASSEIENILTTNDELFKAASDEALPACAETKEVRRYRQPLNHGFRQIREARAQGFTLEDLRAWKPAASLATRGRKKASVVAER